MWYFPRNSEIKPWPQRRAFWCVAEIAIFSSLTSPSRVHGRPFWGYLTWVCLFFWPPSANLHSSGSAGATQEVSQKTDLSGRQRRKIMSYLKHECSAGHYVITLTLEPVFQEMATAIVQSLQPKQLQKHRPDVETAPWANHQSAVSTGQR